MKKRVYLCILAACIALSATACGKKHDTPTISTESNNSTETDVTETESVETETETETVATETTETESVATETESTETETTETETETSETTSTETEVAYKVTDIIPAKTMYAKQPLNTRKGPGLSYDKVSVLKKYEAVTVNGIAEEENWYRLDNGSFVSGKYLLDKLPEEKPVETTKPSESPKPEETKPSESTPAPEEPKHEENNTPSETVKPSESPKEDPKPAPTPSEPETKPSEPTPAPTPTPDPTPSTPSEPEVKPSEPAPAPTPSEPEEKPCEHKNMVQTGWLNGTDLSSHCGSSCWGEFHCSDCGGNYELREMPPTGNHDFDLEIYNESDCCSEAWGRYRCKNCGFSKEYTAPMEPNNHANYEVTEENGHKYCTGCWEQLD